jgi:hypothetical protein
VLPSFGCVQPTLADTVQIALYADISVLAGEPGILARSKLPSDQAIDELLLIKPWLMTGPGSAIL